MSRTSFQHHDSFHLALAFLVTAGLILVGRGDSLAGEDFLHVKGIAGFAAAVSIRNMEAVSISDAESAGADGTQKLVWGQAMLEDLERIQKTSDSRDLAQTEDVFAFRDWCIGAPGRGNLLLAIASEETAVALLFRALAEGQTCGDEVRRHFARCLPNGLSADYWLETLDMEGIGVDCGDALKASDPEYARLGTVMKKLCDMLGGWESLPGRNDTWHGCTDAFDPVQLAFRTMFVIRKEIALEVCLEIFEGAGFIPNERLAFIGAADKYAERTLGKRDRSTSTITSHEVWHYWTAAHEE